MAHDTNSNDKNASTTITTNIIWKNKNLFSKEMPDQIFSYSHSVDSNNVIITININ